MAARGIPRRHRRRRRFCRRRGSLSKDLRRYGLLPESVEFLSPSQAGGLSGRQGAVCSVADQMKEKTGEMPTLAAAASDLGRRGNQGALDAIVRTGIARKDTPTFSGKRTYQGNIDPIVRTGIAREDAPTFCGKRTYDGNMPLSGQESLPRRRLLSWAGGHVTVEGFAPEVA